MTTRLHDCHVYDAHGDAVAAQLETGDRLVLLPDAPLVQCEPDPVQRIRIMWGQRLIDDLVADRYRALVCAVNAVENSHGIISHLAQRMTTSQWDAARITDHAKQFVQPHHVTVVKFDMDRVKVLALLRPSAHQALTMTDLEEGFCMIAAMLRGRADRYPVASVCFLGARANQLTNGDGHEPSFETVLRTMYDAGYRGDVYPAPWMWESAPHGLFPRYPFPAGFKRMCDGGD